MMQRQTMQMQRQGRLPLNYNEGMNPDGTCDKCGEVHEGSCEPKSKSKESKEIPDSRGSYAMMNLIKNKLRSRGLKMSYEPQGEIVKEEDSDRMKDSHLERGGMGARADYKSPPKGVKTGPMSDAEKKKSREASSRAMDAVKASITSKYGKGAIMNTKKK